MVPISIRLQRRARQHQLPAHLLLVKYRFQFQFHLIPAEILVVFHRICAHNYLTRLIILVGRCLSQVKELSRMLVSQSPLLHILGIDI